jgi:hypothetical protein
VVGGTKPVELIQMAVPGRLVDPPQGHSQVGEIQTIQDLRRQGIREGLQVLIQGRLDKRAQDPGGQVRDSAVNRMVSGSLLGQAFPLTGP